MPLSEFEVINRFFASHGLKRPEVTLGIGDDAALITPPSGQQLVVSTDTLIAGVHFPHETSAGDIGYKSLAVSLSDLAAMGAEPLAVTLALTLPEADESWLAEFTEQFFLLADSFNVQLIGGDTTRGALSITVQALGLLPCDQGLTRAGAQVGDLVYVTGELGDAGLALLVLQGELRLPVKDKAQVLKRLNRPTARIGAGIALRNIASAAIDISDGLVADLSHILKASDVGATLQAGKLPVSDVYRRTFDVAGDWSVALSAGDDFELCFTVPEKRQGEIERIMSGLEVRCSWIGMIEQRQGLRVLDDIGREIHTGSGYDHFR
ncbi:MAG: thiamine-phosphate kinase [Gammaproteobacteria bacterium]|nr:MAG: thiamine-phosphate kinase [Gammaproteobacteria bacterium]